MKTIDKKDFKQLKKDFTAWVEMAFNEGYTSFYSEGCITKEAEQTFNYDTITVVIMISAVCSIETGAVITSFFNDIEIVDQWGIEYMSHQINPSQTNELNNLLKATSCY